MLTALSRASASKMRIYIVLRGSYTDWYVRRKSSLPFETPSGTRPEITGEIQATATIDGHPYRLVQITNVENTGYPLMVGLWFAKGLFNDAENQLY
jgi:hypothetical protein